MNYPTRKPGIAVLALVSAMVIAALPVSPVEGAGCKADIASEFRQENEGSDQRIYVWKVDVTTPEVCADVKFKLWVREVAGDGEEAERTEFFEIKASSREIKSRKVNHVVPLSTTVADWRFEIDECQPCG